jgi:hypothetical protein
MKLDKEFFQSTSIINLKNLSRLILVSFFITGLLIYKDYGISWDEMFQRSGGVVNLKYIFEFLNLKSFLSIFFDNIPVIPNSVESLDDWKNEKHLQRFYGVSFDLPAVIIEYLIYGHTDDEQKIYQLRHLLTFLVFFSGICALKNQVVRLFNSQIYGIIAIIFLTLSPRFFGEGFYNCKDIVFMSVVSIGMLLLIKILNKPTIKNIIFYALITAVAVNIRVLGIFFYPLTFFVIFLLWHSNVYKLKELLKFGIFYFFISIFLIYIFFPYLWDAPINNFIEALGSMSSFPVDIDAKQLYMGENISLLNLPWHFLPVWIIITTPPFIVVLFTLGMIFLLLKSLKKIFKKYNADEIFLITNLLIVLMPILGIVFLNSVVYNGWRHVYFIYPSLIVISIYGWNILYKYLERYKLGLYMSLLLFFIFTLSQVTWIVKSHPLQNNYFNIIVGKNWKNKFDMDYWGVGNLTAIKKILESDNRNLITVCAKSYTPLTFTQKILEYNNKKRIKISCNADTDYVIDNYYKSFEIEKINMNTFNKFHDIKIHDEIVISIYKKINNIY